MPGVVRPDAGCGEPECVLEVSVCQVGKAWVPGEGRSEYQQPFIC